MSHWQGDVDWPALVTEHRIGFGACKATEAEAFRDPKFARNWAAIAAAGLVRIAYHFARPDADPNDDVEVFLNYVNPSLPTDLLVLDLEVGEGLGQDAVSAWAERWAVRCRELAPDYSPGVYMGSAYLTNRTGQGLRGPFGWLWYPRYPSRFVNTAEWPEVFAPPPPIDRGGIAVPWPECAWGGLPDFHQFSQSFVTAEGKLDANVFGGTLEELRTLNTRG